MTLEQLANYLRTHRKKSGFSQRELASILGFLTEIQVSRHERSITIPGLLIAVAYEVIFHVPISEMFPGLHTTVKANIEERLAEMEHELHQSTAKGRKATSIARKIEFLSERKNHKAF
jgi:transcriptional regulator with XRE-family HTH domain